MLSLNGDCTGQYDSFFTPASSKRIVESLYDRTDGGRRIPVAMGLQLFCADAGSEVTIAFASDDIVVTETWEEGMFLSVQYTVRDTDKPVIAEWESCLTDPLRRRRLDAA